jgi:hypothetical protein
MIRRISGCIAVLSVWLMASGSLMAHHSLAGVFDLKKDVELTGELTKVAFTNPHGAFHITVKNADGTSTNWILTTGSASTLAGLGFGNGGTNNVKPGDVVTIRIFPARNGNPLGFMRSITLADKRQIQLSTGSASE